MNFTDAVTKEAHKAIEDKVFPGCVVGIVNRNGNRQVLAFGNFTYDTQSNVVKEDTMYDVASITKSIPLGALALQLLDEGKLKLTDKLIDYIPEFRNSDRENVLIKHLLTYTIDGYGLASALDKGEMNISSKSAEDLIEVLLTHDFEKRPGTVFTYSNIPAALLGLVIEKITGETLDVLAERQFFTPLKMNRTTFFPERFSKDEIPPTEIDSWRKEVQGVVHDESAYIAKRDGKIMGHAGVFSTAPDILNFLEMLLHKGEYNGKRYFSEERVREVGENQLEGLDDVTGLGWELNQPRYMGDFAGEHTFGKTGFTGTVCVCDVEKGVAYVILSNRTYPKRASDSKAMNGFRKKIGDIVLGS